MDGARLISIRQTTNARRQIATVLIALGLAFTGSSAFASGNLLPAAHAGPDVSGSVGQVFGFSGNASHDPDGTIVSYLWDFGDGATANGSYATHAFASVGTYTVTLTVTDNSGGVGTDTASAFICPSVQAAINAAATGSTVTLAPCTYVEKFTVNRSITLKGGPGVVFDGGIGQPSPRSGPVATVTANNVTLRDIEFTQWQGNFIYAPNVVGLRLLDLSASSVFQLYLYGAKNVAIYGSSLPSVTIYAYAVSGLTVTETTATMIDASYGYAVRIDMLAANTIYLWNSAGSVSRTTSSFVGASGPVIIEDSTIGRAQVSGGVTLRTSRITGMGCCDSSLTGPVVVERNVFVSPYSTRVSGVSAVIRYNDMYSGTLNFQSGSQQAFSYLNNFYGGSVSDAGFDNRFDTGSVGNYWAGYSAPDANNDSILDNPRAISGSAGSADRYPLAGPFGGLPSSEERAPDATAAPNALVDAGRGVLIPMRGLEEGLTYDLTITNMTPTGAGFGYGYGASGGQYALELRSPSRVLASTAASYTDGLRADRVNVTYPSQTLAERGTWSVEYNGFPIATFAVSPPYYAPTSAPNPSGPSATVRAFDVQEQRFSFPSGAHVGVGTTYDLTFTNITTPETSYSLHDPSGALLAGPANTTEDGLHAGRANATYASVTFGTSGYWTVRTPGGSVIASFEVDAPPGVNPFLADLVLTLWNRTDGATFGAATNASTGFDPGVDIAEPPAPADPTHVRLYFAAPANGIELHRSILYANGTLAWPLVAEASSLNGTANLTWNASQIAAIDPTFSVELSDHGSLVDMRTSSAHTFSLSASHNMSVLVRQASGVRINASLVVLNQTVRVGTSLHVSGSIINDGPHTATGITATLVIDNGTSITVNATPTSITAGAFATFNFPPTVQTTPGDHTARVSVNSTSLDTDINNNVVVRPFFVTKASLNLTVLGPAAGIVGLNGTANYTIRAVNEGNIPENYTISVGPAAPGWSAALSVTNLTLAAGANATTVLTVAAPALATAQPIFTANVVGIASSDPAARDEVSLTTTVHVTHSFIVEDGWSLVSVPIIPGNSSMVDVFGPGAIALYGWNGTGYSNTATVEPGRGYWLFSSGSTGRNLTGVPLGNISVPLQEGWNLVGSPIAGASLDNAPANVARAAFTWGPTGYEESRTLEPGRAYWVNVHNGSATLVLGTAAALKLHPALWTDEPEFVFRVGAEMGALRDAFRLTSAAGTSAGVGLDDLKKAPRAPTAAQLRTSIIGTQDGAPVELHAAAEPPSEFHQWNVQVERSDPGEAVTLRWDMATLASIPPTYLVELHDGAIRIDMRSIESHTLVMPLGATTHAIRIVVASVFGDEVCVASLDGTCVARSPIDPTRALGLG